MNTLLYAGIAILFIYYLGEFLKATVSSLAGIDDTLEEVVLTTALVTGIMLVILLAEIIGFNAWLVLNYG